MTIFYIVFGLIIITIGLIALVYADKISQFLCSTIVICFGAFTVYTGFILMETPTYYLEAEPLAYNYETNLTYFTSAEGQFKTEGIYPENTYLLTMDNNGTSDKEDDIVLVVWEPSEGEVG